MPLNRAANIADFYSLSKLFSKLFSCEYFLHMATIYILALMFEKPEIKLLIGFCTLAFGSGKDEAKLVFGEPEEIQNLSDDILNNNSLVYHYWNDGYSLFFDTNKTPSFCSVEIDNKEALLFETKIFSLKEKEIIDLMKQNGYVLSDSEVHKWGERRISFDEAGLDCYFENGKLVSVNFGLLDNTNFFYFPN